MELKEAITNEDKSGNGIKYCVLCITNRIAPYIIFRNQLINTRLNKKEIKSIRISNKYLTNFLFSQNYCRVGQRNFTSSLSQTPYVNLSIYTAPVSITYNISQYYSYAEISNSSRNAVDSKSH